MAKNQDTPQEKPGQTPNFEQSLERLEEIVHLLEDGQLGLSQSLVRYEEGVKLLRQAYELLEGAQRKIELLSGVDAKGNPVTRPLEDAPTFGGSGGTA
jgi:exodeoxyribonuclease VII small subunit